MEWTPGERKGVGCHPIPYPFMGGFGLCGLFCGSGICCYFVIFSRGFYGRGDYEDMSYDILAADI